MSHPSVVSALRTASLYPLTIIIERLLMCSGFDDVRSMGRRKSRQKSKLGGFDLECRTCIGSVDAKVIVKVLRDDVRIRNVEEMVGTRDRCGAHLGLIIATGNVSKFPQQNLATYRAKGVEWWDGEMLAEKLTRYLIGVRSGGEADFAYFASLEDAGPIIERIRKEVGL